MRAFEAGPLAGKLRAAVEETGCRSLAEFVAHVRTAVPATSVTLDRAYKWLQGRATPHDPGVYDDLAAALGPDFDGEFVRAASAEAFVDRLRARRLAATPGRPTPVTDLVVTSGLRDGAYAMYSPARDSAVGGSVARGCVRVVTDRAGGGRRIEYVERDGPRRLARTGDLVASRRLHTVNFASSPRDDSLFLALAVPGQPVPVVGGLMIGQAQYAVAARPVCCRLLLLAAREPAVDPEAGNGEFGPGSAGIADDIAANGYGDTDCAAVAGRVLDYLTAPSAGQLDISHQAIEEISLLVAQATRLIGAV